MAGVAGELTRSIARRVVGRGCRFGDCSMMPVGCGGGVGGGEGVRRLLRWETTGATKADRRGAAKR